MKNSDTSLVEKKIITMELVLHSLAAVFTQTNRTFLLVLITASLASIKSNVNAQCSNFNSQYPSSTQTINCGVVDQTISTCLYGGEYAVCTVNAGDTYNWNTCYDYSFDSQITVRTAPSSGGIVLAYNDDYCGVQSNTSWTATFSGNVYVLISRYYCGNQSSCMTLRWSRTCPPSGPAVAPICYDFSSGTGGFTNGSGGNSWVAGTTTTPSSNTGPQGADASGGSGFYFTEASGGLSNTTYSMSGDFDVSALSNPEITMDYHMYGSSMGTLSITANGTTLWSQSGNQGNAWNSATVDISAYSGTVTIAIVGTTGGGWSSDMAIDNFCIQEGPACLAPLALTASNITSSSATITWTAPSVPPSNGYVYYVTTSATPPTTGGTAISGTSVNLTGLSSNQTYYIWVASDCGSLVSSLASTSFNTPLPPVVAPVCYDFSSGTGGFTNGSGGNSWIAGATTTPSGGTGPQGADASGGSGFYFTEASGSLSNTTYAMSGDFDISGMSNPEITMDYHMYGTSMGTLSITVNGTSVWSQSGNQGNTWNSLTVDISSYSGTITVAIVGTTGNGYTSDMAIDNFCIQEPPACADPLSVTVASVSTTSAIISWTAPSPAPSSGYLWEVRSSGAAGSGATGLVASGTVGPGVTTVNATLPSAQATYTAYVMSDCGSPSFSSWVGVVFNHPYCLPTYTTGTYWGDLISNVAISGTTLSNYTGTATNGPSYQSYLTISPTPIMEAGSSYTVQVTTGSYTGQNIAVWIDYNDNLVFESSEKIGYSAQTTSAYQTVSFQINLACSPPLGTHRMRVRDVWLTSGASIDPCSNYGYGETEDYLVDIIAATPYTAVFFVAPSGAYCTGASINYEMPSGQSSYTWNISGTQGTDYIISSGGGASNNLVVIQWLTSGSQTVSIDYLNPSGCASIGGSSNTISLTQASVAPTGINGPGSYCLGESVALAVQGGTLQSGDWQWFAGSCSGTALGTGTSINVAPSTSTTYYVQAPAFGVCPATTCTAGTITVPEMNNQLSVNNSTATCTVDQSGYIHFLDNTGRLLISINSNGQNLGNVTVASYLESSPLTVEACDNPGNMNLATAILDRHWLITTEFSPTANVDVRLPFLNAEFSSLANQSVGNLNINDDVYIPGNVALTRYSGPNEDNVFTNNCVSGGGNGNFLFHSQNTNGIVNSYLTTQPSNHLYVAFQVDDFSEFWLHGFISGSPLPVELTSLQANCVTEIQNEITWTTASETNSSHFEVNRSLDGVSWDLVATVQAAGQSQEINNYIAYDNDKLRSETVVYYRLSQIDLDGEIKEYPIISAACDYGNHSLIYVFPNPGSGLINISVQEAEAIGECGLTLFDISGSEVKRMSVNIEKGMNNFLMDGTDLPSGIYFIRIDNDSFSSEIVKYSLQR
jgi:hypothetical protein